MTDEEKKTERQAALFRVARMLSKVADVDEFLDHILETSREVMESEICSVLLPVNAAGDLRIKSTFEHPETENFVVPAGKGISGEVFQTRKPILIRDAASDPRFYQLASTISGIEPRAMMTIPLLDGDRCLGVLQAINPLHEGGYTEDDEEIFETFGSLCAVTLLRLEVQQATLREAQRQEQMGMAKEIQQTFLPASEAQFGDLELSAFYEPASSIGGDFFFWHELEGDRLLCGIGDVAGKGLPAALDMARGSTMIASLAWRCGELSLGDWISAVNQNLCSVMAAGRFIGINAMLVDRRTRRVQICIAGLPAPMTSRLGKWEPVAAPGNPPMGISAAVNYKHLDLPLAAGRHWLVFSDGILEETSAQGEFFEDAAFPEALSRAGGQQDSSGVIDLLQRAWEDFGGENPDYRDDATVIVVTDQSTRPKSHFAFTCAPETIGEGRRFIERWATWCGFDEKAIGMIVLGCDEVLTNIVRHAYHCEIGDGGEGGPAGLDIEVRHGAMVLRVEHVGRGLSDEEFAEKALEPDPAKRIGGMGLFVIREVFDEVTCFPGDPDKDRRAVIELVKKF